MSKQKASGNAGYVYVLSNPSMPGIVKIGKSERDPETRVDELSGSTGVPVSFILEFSQFVEDCDAGESLIHEIFKDRRVNSRREFFDIPLEEAISTIQTELNASSQASVEDSLGKRFYEQAIELYYPEDGYPPDYDAAYNLFSKAKDAGFAKAYRHLGSMHLYGESVRQDEEMAISYFLRGARLGDLGCHNALLDRYIALGRREEALGILSKYLGLIKRLKETTHPFYLSEIKSLTEVYDASILGWIDEFVSLIQEEASSMEDFFVREVDRYTAMGRDELVNVVQRAYSFYFGLLDQLQRRNEPTIGVTQELEIQTREIAENDERERITREHEERILRALQANPQTLTELKISTGLENSQLIFLVKRLQNSGKVTKAGNHEPLSLSQRSDWFDRKTPSAK